MSSNLLINLYVPSDKARRLLEPILGKTAYTAQWHASERDFFVWTRTHYHRTDCLILQKTDQLSPILGQLKHQDILLPTIVIAPEPDSQILRENEKASAVIPFLELCVSAAADYHPAVICLSWENLEQLEQYIHQSIDQFVKLPSALPVNELLASEEGAQTLSLRAQQQRLTQKLKERLGYLGVYYKRNPAHFLRSMSQAERDAFLNQLRAGYRGIIIHYFSSDADLNQKIDDFVNIAFLADVSVSQIVEVHMELMDEFSNQLKLEGRSEEILLDYRLTLIDVIAHLCEMYRRSIPREP
ncbi:MAG: circadian clock protein KaiA [Cyanobacteria bacterium Co-bin13]|nr:circadian clock protein KaiA [Cyanobacteria bacterium Co-bin13]